MLEWSARVFLASSTVSDFSLFLIFHGEFSFWKLARDGNCQFCRFREKKVEVRETIEVRHTQKSESKTFRNFFGNYIHFGRVFNTNGFRKFETWNVCVNFSTFGISRLWKCVFFRKLRSRYLLATETKKMNFSETPGISISSERKIAPCLCFKPDQKILNIKKLEQFEKSVSILGNRLFS